MFRIYRVWISLGLMCGVVAHPSTLFAAEQPVPVPAEFSHDPGGLPAGQAGGSGEASSSHSHEQFDALLKSHVKDGRVDYPAFLKDRVQLDAYIASLGTASPSGYEAWDESTKITFWINAYNAITLKVILDHYPIKRSGSPLGLAFPANSIRQIPGQWDKITHVVMGRPMTLNGIEHETLRKKFREPRIHMALVCAAKGCPPLRSEAYEGKRLSQQLDDQARIYLSSPVGFKLDKEGKTVALSSIFLWFGDDFLKAYGDPQEPRELTDKKRAVVAFASRYVSPDAQAFFKKGGYRLSFLGYDWSLNEKES